MQANWGLQSLGRQDTNLTMNNVFEFIANATGWKNNGISGNSSSIRTFISSMMNPSHPLHRNEAMIAYIHVGHPALLNISGPIPGPLNVDFYIPFAAPDTNAAGAGGQSVFVAPGLNTSLSAAVLPSPVNLTAQGLDNPWGADPGFNYANGTEVIEPTASATAPTSSGSSGGSGSNAAVGAPAASAEAGLLLFGLSAVFGAVIML